MTGISDFINIKDYDYPLPDDKIAKYPLETRDDSKLLIYREGHIESRIFKDLPDLLTKDHHLVFNDTRVIQARLHFQKASGANIELLLLEPFLPSEYNLSFSSNSECTWKCMVGNAKKWKEEILQKQLVIKGLDITLKVEKYGREKNYFLIRLSWDNQKIIFSEIIENAGLTPLPPYLNREPESSDATRYQTVYSEYEGSVAAPTAGLHFTDEVINRLSEKGVAKSLLTLHVGAGTFVPVKTENARDHEMHTEHIYLDRKSIESLYKSSGKLIAVGTTSVRTIESLYHIAYKIKSGISGSDNLFLDQWEAYNNSAEISRKECLDVILAYMEKNNAENLKLSTRIMIAPGYKFRMTEGIITNFHQPSSTLLLLISAFIGKDWHRVYNFALENNYRFLSYGDSSLLLRNESKVLID